MTSPTPTPLSVKEKGNTFFADKKFTHAIGCYTEALELLSTSKQNDKLSKDEIDLKTTLLSNRAQCCLELLEYWRAYDDATAALQVSPSHIKSLFRAATAMSKVSQGILAKSFPQQQIVALHLCEIAFNKMLAANPNAKADDPQHKMFQDLYTDLLEREQIRFKETVKSHPHHLNSPNPLLCFVCHAIPNVAGEYNNNNNNTSSSDPTIALGIRCKCTAASFCCRAHQAIAAQSHKSVCDLMGDVATMADNSDDDDSGLPFGTGKDPFHNLAFLRATGHLFERFHDKRPNGNEFEQLRQIPRCVGCGYFPARHGCTKCSMVSFCGKGGVCLERGLKNVTKEMFGGRTVKKQNNHTPEVCRALLETARAAHLAYLFPKPVYSVHTTLLKLLSPNPAPPLRIHLKALTMPPMIEDKKNDNDDDGDNDVKKNNEQQQHPSPEAIIDKVVELYEKDNKATNANFLYRRYIAPFADHNGAVPKALTAKSDENTADKQEEQQISKFNPSSFFENESFSSNLTFDALVADSYSWPLSLIYGVTKCCSEEVRDRCLKKRLTCSALKAKQERQLLEHQAQKSKGSNKTKQSKEQQHQEDHQAVFEELDKQDTLVIHIVGAENESFALSTFEELLHVFSGPEYNVKHIHIVCVGPGVKGVAQSVDELVSMPMKDLCSGCKAAGYSMTFHWRACLYEDFVEEIEGMWVEYHQAVERKIGAGRKENNVHLPPQPTVLPPRPHICVLFNAGINENPDEEESSWHRGLNAMVTNGNCIRLVTSYDIEEAKQDREIIRKIIAKGKKTPIMPGMPPEMQQIVAQSKARLKHIQVSDIAKNPFSTPLIKSDPTRWNGVTFGAHNYVFSFSG